MRRRLTRAFEPHRVFPGVLGVVAGVVLALVAGRAVASHLTDVPLPPVLEATHLPPLLTRPGEQIELRYDVYCAEGDDEDPPCAVDGTVFARAGTAGAFDTFPVRLETSAEEGRYVALLPRQIAESRDGFSYYAIFRSRSSGAQITLPAGGGAAPQRSVPIGPSVAVRLDAHVFGRTRAADARVAEAAWGDGTNDAGLEQGRNLPPIGGASFDVGRAGKVYVLDEAHRSVLAWRPGASGPSRIPLAVNGTLADMSVADDGGIFVLETTGGSEGRGVLRVFGPDGSPRGTGEIPERASVVRRGPTGLVVLQQPSGQWTSVASDGRVLPPLVQETTGRAGRPVEGGEVIVLRRANEIRVALVSAGAVRHSWIVSSETPLAEVQLAEPVGDDLLVVVRVYSGDRDEFKVLVLGKRGVVRSFSVDSADWAETSPLSRFRIAGSSLYQLGSTPAGLFVDRFDLEVK